MNIYPYVYRLDHPISGEFYIGYRYTNRVPALEDFGYIYQTSTKKLAHPFEEYTQTILAEFFTDTAADDAYDFEQLTIFEHWGDPLLVNKACHYGKRRFSRAGMKVSDETKAKMSVAKRGKRVSDETKRKMSEAGLGKERSAEHRQNISEALRGKTRKPCSDEHKRKISEANQGKTRSIETKLMISEARRGRKHSDETKAKMSAAKKDKTLSDEHKRKLSGAHLRRWAAKTA